MTTTAKPQTRVHMRWMIRRDLPEALAIEKASFPFPWKERDFLLFLRGRSNIGMVAEVGQDVVGYFLFTLHKSRLQVVNFAVDPAWRRQGVGTQMVDKLKSKLHQPRRPRLTIDVPESNLVAQLFFRAQRFLATDVLRATYQDTGEDGYRMEFETDVEREDLND